MVRAGRPRITQAFFGVVGSPEWHGCNFGAVRDSISTDGITRIEVSFQLVIKTVKYSRNGNEYFIDLIRALAAEHGVVFYRFV